MGDVNSERDEMLKRAPSPQRESSDGRERHPQDVAAVAHLDGAGRSSVVQSLQSGLGNAAVQRLLESDADGGATAAEAVQRDVDDEEMPDEAAAG